MRTLTLLFATVLAALSAQSRPSGAAAPACTAATPACTEWVKIGSGPARSLIYRTRSLDVRNDGIRRALIMVHGTNRNADHYFTTATAAAFLAGALDDTVVISPRIASSAGSCKDTLAPDEVSWSCTGDSWRSGGSAVSNPDLTSFDFVDQILRKLANKSVFPNMRAIVVAGHSAGGQFVARYQMANRVHETLGVPVSYVVANPSSYAWPDATRPQAAGDAAVDNAKGAWETEKVHTNFTYGPFDASACPAYDRWPAGLEGRTGGYTQKISDEQLKRQLVSRPTTFLFGQVDTLPLGGFDSSCPAMAQGATRRARGEAYVKYIDEKLGAKHTAQIVSECGHNDRCVYTTDAVLPVIFPK
ncbi:MAG TPA: alpha/beta fold hydrolase [Vicinamibacterales bacterium]|jgi:pimeloyl-ACP methyl ester carboxylesterase